MTKNNIETTKDLEKEIIRNIDLLQEFYDSRSKVLNNEEFDMSDKTIYNEVVEICNNHLLLSREFSNNFPDIYNNDVHNLVLKHLSKVGRVHMLFLHFIG